MNKLSIYAAAVVAIFLFGFGAGWHVKTQRVNAAVVKQVVKVAKTEAKQEAQVEKQNDSDQIKIRALEDELSAARRDAAARRVPNRSACPKLPQAETHARDPGEGSAERESARRYEEAYRALRDELLVAGATSEQLRLQVLACKAQWPR